VNAALALVVALSLPAQFGFEEDEGFELAGSVKTFMVGSIPYDHVLLPEDPALLGVLAARLRIEENAGDNVRFELHPVLVASSAGSALGGSFTQLGVALARPEALDLSFDLAESELGSALFLIDRANVKLSVPHLDVTLGRQAISFGQGFFFTPMDLVTAFSPGTLDREYKPGVDSVRGDLYFGTATRITAVAAYGGDGETWDLDSAIFAAHARTNIIGVDMGVFGSWNRADRVVGFELATDFAGLAVFGEATATFPYVDADSSSPGDEDEDYVEPGRPFLRAVVGAQALFPEGNASLLVEVYAQSLGASDPARYLQVAQGKRFARGELSLMGQLYGAASFSWELDPLTRPGIFALANLQDGSLLFGPSISWSLSDELNLAVGGQFAAGDRPDDISIEELALGAPLTINTEYGLYPSTVFAQLSAYY
jgi:hypothetical protein